MYMLKTHARAEHLGADEQRQLLAWALDRDDMSLVSALIDRDDLDEGVDARIGELSDYKVKAAWMRRPGRTDAQIEAALKGEKRQTVLAALVETEGLPDAVYATCVERITGIKALVELVCGPAPERYRAAGARRLARTRSQLTWSARSRVEQACKESPGVRLELLRHSPRAELVSAALRSADAGSMDDACRRNVVEVLLARPLRDLIVVIRRHLRTQVGYHPPGHTVNTLVKECRNTLALIGAGDGLRDEIAKLFEAIDSTAGDTAKLGTNYQSRALVPTGSLLQVADEIRQGGTFGTDFVTDMVGQMADGATRPAAVAALQGLRGQAGGEEVIQRVVAQSLVAHPSGPVITAALVLRPDYWQTALMHADTSDIEAGKALLAAESVSVRPTLVFEYFDDTEELIRWWLTDVRPDAWRCCQAFTDVRWLPEGEDLDLLPGALVAHTPSYGDSSTLLTAVSRRCFQRWGTNAEAWRMIEQIGRGFSGTLGELFSIIELTAET